MPTPGQNSLSNFYMSVKFADPLMAALISEDVVEVSLNSLALTKTEEAQDAARRLRQRALDMPPILSRTLESALQDLGYPDE